MERKSTNLEKVLRGRSAWFPTRGGGETHERAGGLAKEVCAAGVADGEGAKGVDDVSTLFVGAVEGEAVALDGGLDAEEVVGEEGVRGVGVLGMRGAEAVLELADARLAETGEPPLTFFEALTVLAYAVFADAPIDVGVI